MSEVVQIRDVGPRDGFQNEKLQIPTDVKIDSIDQLIGAGVNSIEITSFVNPARLPQFADADEVAGYFAGRDDVDLWAFAGNVRGLERAADAGLRNVTTAVALSEEINRSNFGKSTAESLAALSEFVARAQSRDVNLEVTVATAFGDIEGRTVTLEETIEAVKQVAGLGVRRIMLGDTVGVATPGRVRDTYDTLLSDLPGISIGAHFHDTRGMAVANVLAAWQAGVGDFDASFGGLGGCPFAPRGQRKRRYRGAGVHVRRDRRHRRASTWTRCWRSSRRCPRAWDASPRATLPERLRSAAVAKQ